MDLVRQRRQLGREAGIPRAGLGSGVARHAESIGGRAQGALRLLDRGCRNTHRRVGLGQLLGPGRQQRILLPARLLQLPQPRALAQAGGPGPRGIGQPHEPVPAPQAAILADQALALLQRILQPRRGRGLDHAHLA